MPRLDQEPGFLFYSVGCIAIEQFQPLTIIGVPKLMLTKLVLILGNYFGLPTKQNEADLK